MFLLDTNLYIRGLTDAGFGEALAQFQRSAVKQLWISAVVVYEVTVGARNAAHAAAWERWLVRPFRTRERVLLPGEATWRIAAEARRRLQAGKQYAASLARASFQNDLLIAATCRERGATLITANARDFEIIKRVIALRYTTSFPSTRAK
ncbi:MAG TPA: type II toxin-antitoxin system VapC family toxin [Gemmatimonadaceae bacterium]|nr:type II toxin-antitoxin system VapC family toxin [Gemmatimonadaceae bacterium]